MKTAKNMAKAVSNAGTIKPVKAEKTIIPERYIPLSLRETQKYCKDMRLTCVPAKFQVANRALDLMHLRRSVESGPIS
jgi:hypothetical protein